MSSKWDNYYEQAKNTNGSPPWESPLPFQGLVEFVESGKLANGSSCVEFGAGSSTSSVYLGIKGFHVDAVDISQLAIDRAKTLPHSDTVNWICADLLDPSLFDTVLQTEHYDFVLDMQCFHCLRDFNEIKAAQNIYRALKPGGYAMVIVGAADPTGEVTLHTQHAPGPPKLTLNALREPLEACGLTTLQISLTRFNNTDHYASLPHGLPPLAWVGIFQRIDWKTPPPQSLQQQQQQQHDNQSLHTATYALEVQAPYSTYILQGKKTVETRGYPLPPALIGQPILLLEPARGEDKISTLPSIVPMGFEQARVIGIVVFESCTRYISSAEWGADREKHMVPVSSAYDWKDCVVLHESNEMREFHGLEDGKISELYAWKVGFVLEEKRSLPVLQRSYRSLFQVL